MGSEGVRSRGGGWALWAWQFVGLFGMSGRFGSVLRVVVLGVVGGGAVALDDDDAGRRTYPVVTDNPRGPVQWPRAKVGDEAASGAQSDEACGA
jgi:hypothetical protein